MDPLSAFALAGTVYTFIDAGITVTKFAKELGEFWKSSRETTESVGHLTITTQNLEALSSELRNVNEPEFLKSIAIDCVTLCQELSGLLDKLKVKDKKSKSEHLSVMFSAYRRKDKISSIEERLGKLRAQMTLDLLRAMNHRQSDIKKVLDEVQNDARMISAKQSENFREGRIELLDLLRACEKNRQQDYSAIIIKLREFQSKVSCEQIQNRILQTLRFDGMYSREDNTPEASEGTFGWLLEKDIHFEETHVREKRIVDKMQMAREAFLAWLQAGEGVFHVCGKAGSGKSTLMKLICTSSQTRGGLKVWAGDDTLLHASFFFFAPGEKEAKSMTGLYRCVLFTILNEHRDLMSKVYPGEFRSDRRQSSPQFLDLLRPQQLEKAVQSLIDTAATGAYKMCIFIDGLDEYEGSFADYWQLADRLLGWADQNSGRAKFCVSSRPEVQFVKTFGSKCGTYIRQIHLHEFTSGDIEKHCHDQFAKSPWFKGSGWVPDYGKFVDHIVDRAEGVFLWAVLVTKVLLYETRKDGFERDLWRRLEEIPDDVNALYDRLFDYMGKEQRRKCNLILLAILTNPLSEPLNARSLNFIYDEEDLDQALLKQHNEDQYVDHERQVSRVIDNLAEWTRGLVEAISWDQAAGPEAISWEQAVGPRECWDEHSPATSPSTTSVDEDPISQNLISGQSANGYNMSHRITFANIDDNISQNSDETVGSSSGNSIYATNLREKIEKMRQTPLFRIRVRLFHKTVQDYIQNSASFRKLQSDFSKFDVVETHSKLRLLELGPVNDMRNLRPRWIYGYVYAILEMIYGDGIGKDTQISWPVCKAIGLLLPTRVTITLYNVLMFFKPPGYQVQPNWKKWIAKETSLPHLAAFFGHPEALGEAQCISRSSEGLIEGRVSTPNLLLSACLGRIFHSDNSVRAGTSNSGIITKVLDLGYSGHDRISVIGGRPSVPIWHLLILALSFVDPLSTLQLQMPSAVDRLLEILAQLLEFESQKEVLMILPSLTDSSIFYYFVTIRDVVESFYQWDSSLKDSLLRQLKDEPQYESEKPPAWVHAAFEGIKGVPDSRAHRMQENLHRLGPSEYLQWKAETHTSDLHSIAVVSNDVFLVGNRMAFVDCKVSLW